MAKKYKKQSAIVYVATNIANGNKYIGITSRPLKQRISGHFSAAKHKANDGAFYKALAKYGRGGFEWAILMECPSYLDAAREEIRLIKELSPVYNSTSGGEGRSGHLIHESTRKKFRARGVANKEKWAAVARLGPLSMAKPVICANDGLLYESASAAARFYNVPKSAVIEICLKKKHRKSIGGLSFDYLPRPEMQ